MRIKIYFILAKSKIIVYSIFIGNENKQMCVLPLIPRGFAREIGGGVYGRFFTIPNNRIYDVFNYKRCLIEYYIHSTIE